MVAIGPWEFTDEDVRTTLGLRAVLFDVLTGGLPASAVDVVAPFRARAEAELASLGRVEEPVVLAAVWEEWRAAAAALRTAGAYGPSDIGTVAGLFRSDGGVPKAPLDAVDVDFTGVVGDRQVDRANHGRPFQALCLWSTEVIDAFVAEGNPLAPGLAGENVSITGLEWARVRPGVHLRLGDVLAEVSAYAIPCSKNAAWFADGRFDRMHHKNGPVSRMYATVLEPGRITVGAPVLLEPDA
jgi:hypothetical protein